MIQNLAYNFPHSKAHHIPKIITTHNFLLPQKFIEILWHCLIEIFALTLASSKNRNSFYKYEQIMKPLLKSSFFIIIQGLKTVLFMVTHWIFGIQNNVTFSFNNPLNF
jgi:hypothetical protein